MRGCPVAALALALTFAGSAQAHKGLVTFDPKASYVDPTDHVQLYFFNKSDEAVPLVVLIQGNVFSPARTAGKVPPQKGVYIDVGVRPNGVTFKYSDEPSDKPDSFVDGQFDPRKEKPAPPRIVGVWRGPVNQPGAPPYSVRMTITSENGGTTDYPEIKCGGALTGGPSGRDTYTFQEKITYGRATDTTDGGIDGTITVRLLDDNTLSWSWKGSWKGKEITASATLKKDGR
jgi:hypothetical protein